MSCSRTQHSDPTSVKNRVISPFREGFIFVKLRILNSLLYHNAIHGTKLFFVIFHFMQFSSLYINDSQMFNLAKSEDPDEMLHKIITCDPWIYTMDHPKFIVSYK